ncbi:hypothetical protein K443DRAFT_277687 [Laccaria amethystina LaAM-08-1]|uniref:Uncharacterized protein n=1 Tax=Laccaria amethystina LaAM-08-1 TaxID=1095629 RepID=A0A0C9XXL6_9AGAR|nr:hypothetical protein K443DRAFT_277687 [Laccaria amethystina LaAM-08-1]
MWVRYVQSFAWFTVNHLDRKFLATSNCKSCQEKMVCVHDMAWLRLNRTLDGFCIREQDIVNHSACSSPVYSFVCNPPRAVEVK